MGKSFKDLTPILLHWAWYLIPSPLIFVYLFNYKVLRLELYAGITVSLRTLISFFNITMIGFAMSIVCIAIVMPTFHHKVRTTQMNQAIISEPKHFLWSQFRLNMVPLLLLSEILIITSSIFLQVHVSLIIFLSVLTGLICLGYLALAVGLSASSSKVHGKGLSAATSIIIYLIVSLVFTLVTLFVFAFPANIWQRHILAHTSPTPMDFALTVLALIIGLFVLAYVVILPMKLGTRALKRSERLKDE